MAVENKFSVRIGKKDGSGEMINYTHYAVFPIKFANLLDERLDECYLSMRHMQRQEFKPMTPVEIVFHNRVFFGWDENEKDTYNHDESIRYFVANDRAIESPIGSKHYNHELYLIEMTKYLEMFVVDSLTFTNNLGKDYVRGAQIVAPILYQDDKGTAQWTPDTPLTYTSPVAPSKELWLVSIYTLYKTQLDKSEGVFFNFSPSLKVYRDGIVVSQTTDINTPINVTFLSGLYTVEYRLGYQMSIGGATTSHEQGADYTFTIVSNQYPLKRLTCTDVINRLLDLSEPLRLGESPRFTLNAEQASIFEEVYAPQFSMTRQTLRECLKEVGKVLHGEPRLRLTDNGAYEIYYDMYGGTKKNAWIGRQANIYKSAINQIETYCSSIDSSAQNLINQTDWAGGVITEPSLKDYRTVRTETQYIRITDANMIISSDRPIYQIQSLHVVVPNGTKSISLDITPYVVESTIYNSQLSSYKPEYPYSKAYGIYYTQGEKNIKGLNFKVENPYDPIFSNYAIVNIIQRAASAAGIAWTPPSEDEGGKAGTYPKLAFQITYIPFFDIRVAQTKSYYKGYNKSIALIVNQSANTIESKYFGENLKGTVARLGNPEVSITYTLARWWQIPKAGSLYDDDHYISAVYVEFLPTYIKCTVGLSKDFNRLNEYIGVSSEKRYYEVSERQTYDRSILYHDYIVIGDEEEADTNLIGQDFMDAVADTFTQTGNYKPLTTVTAWGGTYKDPVSITVNGKDASPLPCVQLPVVSTAFGNSMAFMWNYQDNYSAGSVSQYEENGDVSGYWQTDYQYTDYYGKMYYYNFDVFAPAKFNPNDNFEKIIEKGMSLPAGTFPIARSTYLSTKALPYKLRKDSREIPQVNAQIEFVTNRQDLIIGSALASSCGLIRGSDSTLKASLYVLDTPINKFTTVLSATPEMSGKELPDPVQLRIKRVNNYRFYIESAGFPNAGKSWVIVTNQTTETQTVEDEYGNISQQTIYKGGELLLAKNGDVNIGDNIGQIYFTPKHLLFGEKYKVTINYGEGVSKVYVNNQVATNGQVLEFRYGTEIDVRADYVIDIANKIFYGEGTGTGTYTINSDTKIDVTAVKANLIFTATKDNLTPDANTKIQAGDNSFLILGAPSSFYTRQEIGFNINKKYTVYMTNASIPGVPSDNDYLKVSLGKDGTQIRELSMIKFAWSPSQDFFVTIKPETSDNNANCLIYESNTSYLFQELFIIEY